MKTVNTPQTLCRFGLATRDITPPVGMYHRMWGAARQDCSAGVHRPLRGTAVVFGDHARRQWRAIVAIDHCLLFAPEAARLRARLLPVLDRDAPDASLDDARLVMTFSHTHGAGLLDPARAAEPGGDILPPYLDELGEKLAEALAEALDQARSTDTETCLTYATGRCDLARHRDLLDDERGEFVCGFNPDAGADDSVLVVRATNPARKTIATLVNYACHPTTLAWDNELVSPDFPGAMRELVEESTGAPCVFLQGASGDLGPRDGFSGDPRVADRNGRQLGFAALATLEGMPPARTALEYGGAVVSGATIGTWEHRPLAAGELEIRREWRGGGETIELPYRGDLTTVEATQERLEHWTREESAARAAGRDDDAAQARALAERMTRQLARLSQLPEGESYPYEVAVWRLGDAVWIAAPGEPYNLLQSALRARFPGAAIVVMTLSDGWGPSYLPTRETYGRGIYQESVAVVEAGGLERVIETLARRLDEVIPSPRP